MDDVTPRQLLKQINGTYVVASMGESLPSITTIPARQWDILPQTNAPTMFALARRTYIDLAGYTQNELTTFVQSVAVQHMRDPLKTGDATTPIVWSYDFVTTRRVSTEELSNLINDVPGYLPSTLDLQEMVYGQHRTYATNANIPFTFITTDTDTLGSGNPSAADRLHWTRVFLFEVTGGIGTTTSLSVYPANLVCQAVTGKEKDLVYIERLRRSYTQERS
jgi:hypothetical protein